MSTERNSIFDYAKGVGIILVVYGHVVRGLLNAGLPMDKELHGLVDSIIYSFHMPLFFFLSGAFLLGSLAKRRWKGLVLNKVDTIFYPYIIWSLGQGLLEVALSGSTNGNASLEQVFALLWQPRGQFWFLYELFAVFVLAGLLYRRSDIYWVTGVLVASIALYVSRYSPVDLYVFNSFGAWFVFFAFGVSVSAWPRRFGTGSELTLVTVTVAFLASQWGFHQLLGLRADSSPTFASLLVAAVGIAFVMACCQWLMGMNWSWLKYLGSHSMEIYLAHVIAGSGVRIFLQKFLGINDSGIHLVLGLLSGIGLPLLLVIFCRRAGLEWLFHPPRILCLDPHRRAATGRA